MIEPTTGESTKLVSPTLAQPQVVQHINVGQRYRIKIERAASTKGVDGFTVEANGDDLALVKGEAADLYAYAMRITRGPEPTPSEPKEAKP